MKRIIEKLIRSQSEAAQSNPWPANGLKLLGVGGLLVALGAALIAGFGVNNSTGAPVVIGAVIAGFGLGHLLSFGHNWVVVRCLVALIVGGLGSVSALVALDRALNPPPPPVPYKQPRSVIDDELAARLDALANAKVITPKFAVSISATGGAEVAKRLEAALAPFRCPDACESYTLIAAEKVTDEAGRPFRTLIRTPADEAGQALVDEVLEPFVRHQ